MQKGSAAHTPCGNRKAYVKFVRSEKLGAGMRTLLCCLAVMLSSATLAHARTVVVGCHTVRNISHSRVHFGMTVMGSQITDAEKNYLHGQYHHLAHACTSNPKATARLRVSPQLSALMSDYGF